MVVADYRNIASNIYVFYYLLNTHLGTTYE